MKKPTNEVEQKATCLKILKEFTEKVEAGEITEIIIAGVGSIRYHEAACMYDDNMMYCWSNLMGHLLERNLESGE